MLVGEFLENVGKWCENVGECPESIWENVGDLGWNSFVFGVLFC